MTFKAMTYLLACSFVFLIPGLVYSDTTCPDAWVAYHGSCYLFAHDQLLTFTEAQHFCKQHSSHLEHSSHLVHIDSVHENNFLRQFLTHFKSDDWWIGLTDTVIEGEWQWIDTSSNAKYLEWGPSEPDNSNTEEDCAVTSRNKQFKWADVPCSGTFQPICEEK